MNISDTSFLNLPFSKLFQDYITKAHKLAPFFNTNPFSDEGLESALNSYSFEGDRDKTVSLLKDFNKQFGATSKTIKSIERLLDDNSIAVVTGQQLTLYGGPLFTIYKILTSIHFARKWEEKYDIPCVPVFWLADEDHDYDEVATLGFPLNDDHKKVTLVNNSDIDKRVSEITLPSNFEQFREDVLENQFDTDFTDQLFRKLDSHYQEDSTLGKAFGSFILDLFGDHELILAGSAHKGIKQHVSSALKKSVEEVSEHYSSLKNKTDELISSGYHGQVHLQPSNIFWIDEAGNRIKLSYDDERWVAEENGKSWTSSELITEIQNKPDRFSPNVFLRPILQNELLPGFAYIAGPGEVAYYAQMKQFYNDFDQVMPVIIPRFSITLVESGIDRIFDKLPFTFPDYYNRIEDLESKFVEQSDSPDINSIFEGWKEKIDDVSAEPIDSIKNIDPTLEGSSEKAKAAFFTELDKLKGKVFRSVKEQEQVQINRIRKIKSNLFPNDNLQEREIAFIYIMNKYGLSVWDEMLHELETSQPDSHKIIRL